MHRSVAAALSVTALCMATMAFAQTATDLRPPTAFAAISDQQARSAALFAEAGKVLQHPRCLNCHPASRQPTQGDDLHPHVPLVQAGPQDRGAKELPCSSCHGSENTLTLGTRVKSVPGISGWALAPASMAWQGLSLPQVCAQLKDPQRNGNRTLARIHEHLAQDPIVGWAWHPGEGRRPAPGSQAVLGALIGAWIETGAQCPIP